MALPSFTKEQIDAIEALIKSERPDLWATFEEHERRNEGFSDIADALVAIMRGSSIAHELLPDFHSKTLMLREIRIRVRRGIGLPT